MEDGTKKIAVMSNGNEVEVTFSGGLWCCRSYSTGGIIDLPYIGMWTNEGFHNGGHHIVELKDIEGDKQ